MLNQPWRKLQNWAEKLNYPLDSNKLNQFQTYYQLLLTYNQKINLISRQDTQRIVSYHFIDSLAALSEIPIQTTVADFGSGAGLPGIPLKIVRDDIKLYLIESIQKKAYFLNMVIQNLSLTNTFILNQRVENINHKFDIIVARLFGKIYDVLPLAVNLLNKNGKIVFYKISGVESEISKAYDIAHTNNLQLIATKNIQLPITKINRKLVIYQYLL